MRICFDVSYVQHGRAGLGRLTTELLPALLAADQQSEYILHGWSYSLDGETLSAYQRSNVRMATARIPGNLKRWYWTRLRFPALEQLLGSFDLFHSADAFLPPLRKAKAIATVHDLASLKFPEFFDNAVLRMNRCLDEHVQRAHAIIVPSENTKHDVVAMMNAKADKVHVIRPPVCTMFDVNAAGTFDDCVARKYSLNKPFILFVGTLEPRKNVRGIVEAYGLLQKTHPNECELVLVGRKGWMCQPIVRSIEQSPLRSKIRHYDSVSDQELAVFYRRALMFVYPSFYEGHGSPVVEAMASGIPIITSANSSLREIADGVALLVDPAKPNEITEAMHMLMENEVRRVEMRQRGLQVSKQFSSVAAARKVLDVYNTILAR